MVKVAQMNLPAGYQELLDKILSYFDNQIYPTWATRYFHNTRMAKERNKEKTYLPGVQAVWKTLDAPTKALWKSAASFLKWSNYQYFTAKYSYHKKHGLSFPISPNQTVQMYGLKVSNPGGSEIVGMVRQDIICTGQITVAFKYKKIEYSLPLDQSFGFHADCFYFKDGENLVDTFDWVSPTGNIDWTAVSQSFGVSGRYYFHIVLTFALDFYDVDVFLDNFLISDMYGDVYREPWAVKDGKPWAYTPFYRKRGWTFDPYYAEPFFQIEYIDD